MDTTEWWAEITYPPTDTETTDALGDAMAHAMSAAPATWGHVITSRSRTRIEMTIQGGTLTAAYTDALDTAKAVWKAAGGHGKPTGLRLITADARDAEIAHPAPIDLVGITEIADLLGVQRQRADELTHSADFPAPVGTARGGRYWTLGSVKKFAQRWQRKPGRPARG